MVPFEKVIVPLSAALGLSVVVERILEFFKNFFEPFIGAHGTREIPKLSETEDKIKNLETMYKNSEDAHKKEWDESFPQSTILVEPATDPDDGTTLRVFVIQLLGFAAGIILARISNVQLFNAFLGNSHPVAPWVDYVLTGLLIGGGSAPVHTLIRFISERTVSAGTSPSEEEKEVAIAPEAKPSAPAVILTPSDAAAEEWVDIPYNGGIDLEVLENVHKRDKNPSLIVYHHTAMSSKSTFEDVVRIIKSRTDSAGNHWLTGYNCVIQADGSINPFCRWDRYGAHAAGYNKASLGLAFNGNYETDPKIPFSNPEGKYGLPRPTELQLKAGARVVALWTFLYPIDMNFDKAIIPHKKISNKTCPGSQFPYEEFRKWIEFYRSRWERSTAIQERIAAFKLKPYLYVKEG